MMDFDSFIKMGGYAFNVWGAYGLAVIGYGALLIHAIIKCDRLRKEDRQK